MEAAKIQFSTAEMELMCNAEVILTKNKVLEKIRNLLEKLQTDLLIQASTHQFYTKLPIIHPKISKGENYLGLPYLILDYPRQFDPQNIFAIRTMFWWGQFFSTTLHLAGISKTAYKLNVLKFFDVLAANDFYVGINADPWQHHFEADNYKELKLFNKTMFAEQLAQAQHLKIACKTSLSNEAYEPLLENWKLLFRICLD